MRAPLFRCKFPAALARDAARRATRRQYRKIYAPVIVLCECTLRPLSALASVCVPAPVEKLSTLIRAIEMGDTTRESSDGWDHVEAAESSASRRASGADEELRCSAHSASGTEEQRAEPAVTGEPDIASMGDSGAAGARGEEQELAWGWQSTWSGLSSAVRQVRTHERGPTRGAALPIVAFRAASCIAATPSIHCTRLH